MTRFGFLPVLRALRRHRAATCLIGLQIALAFAVLCNACFMLGKRIELMHVVSGVDEAKLVVVSLKPSDRDLDRDTLLRIRQALRGLDGVDAVSMTNAVPFTPRAGEMGFRSNLDDPAYNQQGHFYVADSDFVRTVGVRLVAGRWIAPGEVGASSSFLPSGPPLLVSASYARKLWPSASPLGQRIYADGAVREIVGVIDNLARPDPEPLNLDSSMLVFGDDVTGPVFVLRTETTARDRVLRRALDTVARVAPALVIDPLYSDTLSVLRDRYFATQRTMIDILLGIIAAMLLVTALGIVGLASFWVQQRRRQIGIRRAIGARRIDILGYFLAENFFVVGGGIAIGIVLAFALNLFLMTHYELPRLPLAYLPLGALSLWLLGQVAVLGPALRAASVPPVVATRGV